MNAILLSAGYGKRLKKITKTTPKCLLPIKGNPIIDIWIEKLVLAGVKKIIINTHYKSKMVKKHLSNSKYKKKIIITYEKKLLGTGGTLINNINKIKNEETFLIHVDNYTELNISKFIKFHKNMKKKDCLVSLIYFVTKDFKDKGILKISNKKIVSKIFEKSKTYHGKNANGAVYILSKKFLKIISKKYKNSKDFINDILIDFQGRIAAYKCNSIFLDIGTVKNYMKVKWDILLSYIEFSSIQYIIFL